MKKHNFILFAITSSLLLASCSSKPEIGDVEQNLKDQISHESNGRIELVSIEKTNSIDQEFMGQKVHIIDYKAKIKILEDCFMYVNKSGTGPFIKTFKTFKEQPEFIPSLEMQFVECDKGTEVSYDGSASFSDTENGWILNQ